MNALELFKKQAPRVDRLSTYFGEAAEALDFMGVDRKKATAEQWRAAVDLVRMALAIQSADALDEQLTGFAMLLSDGVEALRNGED